MTQNTRNLDPSTQATAIASQCERGETAHTLQCLRSQQHGIQHKDIVILPFPP